MSQSTQDISTQLSPQSAFWAIAAIALTTMTDVPVRVFGYPKQATFYLKASPVVCLLDALHTLLTLLCELALAIPKHGVTAGCGQATRAVVNIKLDLNDDDTETPEPIRLVLFLFGLVPQVVKLFSTKGIMITQLMVGCYLISFFIDEIVFRIGKRLESQQRAGTTDYIFTYTEPFTSSLLARLAIMANAIYYGVMVFQIDQFQGSTGNLAYTWAYLAYTLILLLLFGWTGQQSIRHEILFFAVCNLFGFARVVAHLISVISFKSSISDGIFLVFIVLMMTGMMLGGAVSVWVSWSRSHTSRLPLFTFFVLAGCNLAIYYYIQYTPSGTYKPTWSEWLG